MMKGLWGVTMLSLVTALTACAGGGGSGVYHHHYGHSPWRGYYDRPIVVVPPNGDLEAVPPIHYPEGDLEAVPLPEPSPNIPDMGMPDDSFEDFDFGAFDLY